MYGRRALMRLFAVASYVAVYQRLTRIEPRDAVTCPQWYGASSGAQVVTEQHLDAVVRAAEATAARECGDPFNGALAAGLASIVGWTHRVIFDALTDPRQPAQPWTVHGAGSIDCGPASDAIRLASSEEGNLTIEFVDR